MTGVVSFLSIARCWGNLKNFRLALEGLALEGLAPKSLALESLVFGLTLGLTLGTKVYLGNLVTEFEIHSIAS